jgi:hypothetical protein
MLGRLAEAGKLLVKGGPKIVIAGDEFETPHDEFAKAFPVGDTVRHPGDEPLDDRRNPALDEFHQHVFLVGEVLVEGGPADTDGGGEFAKADLGIPGITE